MEDALAFARGLSRGARRETYTISYSQARDGPTRGLAQPTLPRFVVESARALGA